MQHVDKLFVGDFARTIIVNDVKDVVQLTATRRKLCVIQSLPMIPLSQNRRIHSLIRVLTPSTPAVPNCCCSKGSWPYWSNPLFLISDIRALWRSGLSARAPECQKLKMVG